MNRKEINAMTDEELCIKAAQIIGLNIVHEEWPCGYPPESCGLEADQMPVLDNNEWTTDSPDWYNRKYPVHLESGLEHYWPPKYDDKCDDWMTAVEPVPDYPNKIAAALTLVDFLADIGGRHIMVRFDALRTDDENNPNWTIHISPDIRFDVDRKDVPKAITKAFIMAMESE